MLRLQLGREDFITEALNELIDLVSAARALDTVDFRTDLAVLVNGY